MAGEAVVHQTSPVGTLVKLKKMASRSFVHRSGMGGVASPYVELGQMAKCLWSEEEKVPRHAFHIVPV